MLDERYHCEPHDLPPAYLVSASGAPYDAETQRLVPGREQLALEQLTPRFNYNQEDIGLILDEAEVNATLAENARLEQLQQAAASRSSAPTAAAANGGGATGGSTSTSTSTNTVAANHVPVPVPVPFPAPAAAMGGNPFEAEPQPQVLLPSLARLWEARTLVHPLSASQRAHEEALRKRVGIAEMRLFLDHLRLKTLSQRPRSTEPPADVAGSASAFASHSHVDAHLFDQLIDDQLAPRTRLSRRLMQETLGGGTGGGGGPSTSRAAAAAAHDESPERALFASFAAGSSTRKTSFGVGASTGEPPTPLEEPAINRLIRKALYDTDDELYAPHYLIQFSSVN